jgi:hypothetical protein
MYLLLEKYPMPWGCKIASYKNVGVLKLSSYLMQMIFYAP